MSTQLTAQILPLPVVMHIGSIILLTVNFSASVNSFQFAIWRLAPLSIISLLSAGAKLYLVFGGPCCSRSKHVCSFFSFCRALPDCHRFRSCCVFFILESLSKFAAFSACIINCSMTLTLMEFPIC